MFFVQSSNKVLSPHWQIIIWWIKRNTKLLIITGTLFLLIGSVGVFWYSGMTSYVRLKIMDMAYSVALKGGLQLNAIEVNGINYLTQNEVIEALNFQPDITGFDIDLKEAHKKLTKLGWVDTARLYRQLSGVLVVDIVERVPVASWLSNGKKMLIDRQGQAIVIHKNGEFEDLIVISGEDSNIRFNKLRTAYAKIFDQEKLNANIKAAQLLGRRRWDLIFDNGIYVKLPSYDENTALNVFKNINPNIYLKDLTLGAIDLRISDRITFDYNQRQKYFNQESSGIIDMHGQL